MCLKSNPLVGSSKISSFFSPITAWQIASLCLCPPDNIIGWYSAYSSKSNFSSNSLISCSEASSFASRHSFFTLSENNWWLTSCMTIPNSLVRAFSDSFFPWYRISPPLGLSRPHKQLQKVDFPAPFFPVIPMMSPALADKLIFWKIICFFLLHERLQIWSTASSEFPVISGICIGSGTILLSPICFRFRSDKALNSSDVNSCSIRPSFI